MADKILYTNKVKTVDLPNPNNEKFRADDANEIKTVVNSHADDIDNIEASIVTIDGDLSTAEANIATNTTNISNNAAAIATKANSSTVSDIDSRLITAEGKITNAEDEIVINAANIASNTSNLNNKVELGGDLGGTINNPIINNEAITNAKLAHIPTNRIKGRASAGSNVVEDLTVPQVKSMLSINNVDNTSDADKPISTAQATEFSTKIDKNIGATYTTNALTTVTQSEYDALTPDSNTLYFIV